MTGKFGISGGIENPLVEMLGKNDDMGWNEAGLKAVANVGRIPG